MANETKKRSTRSSFVSEAPRGKSVLLVDDDHLLRSTVDRELGKRGWTVHYASDGLRALQILPEIMPLYGVIADEYMPSLSGCQLLEAIRDTQLRAFPDHPVRLVLLSGDPSPEARECCRRIGAQVFTKGSSRFSQIDEALRG